MRLKIYEKGIFFYLICLKVWRRLFGYLDLVLGGKRKNDRGIFNIFNLFFGKILK